MKRKASANMWWIIIGAVIALVVMIVLMVMFTDKSNRASSGLLDCESKGGDCGYSLDECKKGQGSPSTAFDCPDSTKTCCFGYDKNKKT